VAITITEDGSTLEFPIPIQEGFGQSYSDVNLKSVYVKLKAIGLTYFAFSEGNQEIRGRQYRIDITRYRIADVLLHFKSEAAHCPTHRDSEKDGRQEAHGPKIECNDRTVFKLLEIAWSNVARAKI
jgi:hypothetical protein